MKNKLLFAGFIILLLFFIVHAEDDPFADLNFETSADNTNTAVNENSGYEKISQSVTEPSEDISPFMDTDISKAEEELLFSEETAAGFANSTSEKTQTTEIDLLLSESAATTLVAQTKIPEKQIVKKEPSKKWIIKTIKAEPLTDFIYTKKGNLGMHRKLLDHLKYDIKTSSEFKNFGVLNINDNFADTAWVENGKKEGLDETITFSFREITFAPVYEKKYKSIEVKEIRILNGFCKDEELWQKYNRVKKLKILLNKQVKYYVNLHDSKNWQIIRFPAPITIKSGDIIKMEIVDVYPEIRNARIANTAISEIYLIGGPAGPKVENKYIASHLLTK